MAMQNRAGANTHPWRTPDDVLKRLDSLNALLRLFGSEGVRSPEQGGRNVERWMRSRIAVESNLNRSRKVITHATCVKIIKFVTIIYFTKMRSLLVTTADPVFKSNQIFISGT